MVCKGLDLVFLSLVLWLTLDWSRANIFSPKLVVSSCNRNTISFTISNATDGGIVYILGSGPGCNRSTLSGYNTYSFDFSSCNVIWGRLFRIVIQRKSLYQTGDDKIIPITCIADLSDITVQAGSNIVPGQDDTPQTTTTKPAAYMTLLSNGNDVRGKMVQLTDSITLSIELFDQYKGDFDIKASICTASTITIIDRGCSADTDLFPSFSKPRVGFITSTFRAFVPTEQTGSIVSVQFSCTLDVCLRSCITTHCPNRPGGYGRKRRAHAKHANITYDQLHVGSALMISNDDGVKMEGNDTEKTICMERSVFIGCLIFMFFLVLLIIYFVVMTCRWRHKATQKKYPQSISGEKLYSEECSSVEELQSDSFLWNSNSSNHSDQYSFDVEESSESYTSTESVYSMPQCRKHVQFV
ncbi:uncharacterized protein LOC127721639 [Mytilus californianus]|uniref:uncharacterized protein LOC127721639 n=1 Tax=Mytilus californianus TaxID=6549 RepID=UPI00224514AD|nr:uncharacterized protein LOC127721639 [Mytilus californianus]